MNQARRSSPFLAALALTAAFGLLGCAKQARNGPVDRSDVPLRIEELTKHIRVVQDGNYWGANSVYYVSEEAIFFLDATYLPQTAGRMIWKSMTQGYGEFQGVLISSYQVHRTGGLVAFHQQEIPVLSSVATENLIRQRWLAMDARMGLFSSWPHPPMPLISRTIRKSGTMFNGKVQVLMMPPGYAPGNLAFYFPEEKVLYAGSMLSIPLFYDEDVNLSELRRCIRILKKKDIRYIIAGHGDPIQGPDFLDRMDAYLIEYGRSR